MDRRKVLKAIGIGTLTAFIPGKSAQAAPFLDLGYSYNQKLEIFKLPKSTKRRMAWTIDDGTSVYALRKYLEFARDSNARLTFFVYSDMSSWTTLAPMMRPMIRSGQIQVANHTAHHQDLTTLSDKQIKKALMDCHHFILDTYGVDARPFFRPPFGAINDHVAHVAASIGYTKPVIWSGTLADSSAIPTSSIWRLAQVWVGNRIILLGHANNKRTAPLLYRIKRLARSRSLKLVTLNDVYMARPKAPTHLKAVARDASAFVSWNPVTNAQSYTVTVVETGAHHTVQSPKHSHVVTGLVNGEQYRFTVYANVFGRKSYVSSRTAAVMPHGASPSPTPIPSSPEPTLTPT